MNRKAPNRQPLKQILSATRDYWDLPEIRPAVRQNFEKMLRCRTRALGAEIYASATEQKYVYHTCKSRACPSCGHLATERWQRDQWAALPEMPYVGITLTMPDVLWPIFQQNRHLLHDLPAVGAEVIQQWARSKYGVRLLIIVVPHTFGRKLNFNSHLHVLVSASGLNESNSRWTHRLLFDKKALMHMWRYAVIMYLREALTANLLSSNSSAKELKALFTTQYERWWNINVDHFKSKWHFLRYAGRYVRRPPIAQHRFLEITKETVRFWTKDLKLKQKVKIEYPAKEFVTALSHHVPDYYRHGMRYFGLLAPRSKGGLSDAVFLLLKQKIGLRPKRLRWAELLQKHFRTDPLRDRTGQHMSWVGRLKATV